MNEILLKIRDISMIIFIVGLVGMCTASIIISDNYDDDIYKKTEYFKITNKDYVNTSSSMLRDNYKWVIYIDRYDSDKKYINCSRDLKRISVTKYDYDRFGVGIFYNKRKENITTYAFY
jgi:hypothetical protein